MQAKMKCGFIKELTSDDGTKRAEEVNLYAVTSTDPTNPNYSWAKSTPLGNCSLTIENEGAFGHFQPGKEYVLTFQLAD